MSKDILTGITRKTLSASRIDLLKNLSDVQKNKGNKQRNTSLADSGLIQLLVATHNFVIQKTTVLTVFSPFNGQQCGILVFFVSFFFFSFYLEKGLFKIQEFKSRLDIFLRAIFLLRYKLKN